MEQGTQIHNEEDIKIYLENKELFGVVTMRAYFRALFGMGNTLRKMKRAKEALPYCEKLADLDQQDGSSSGSYINYNAHFPELWLRAYGPEECLKRALKYKYSGCIEYHSCQVPWYATLTLALFASERVTSYDFPEPSTPRPTRSGYTKEAIDGFAPLYLIRNHPHVVNLLTGKRRLPSRKIPMQVPGSESLIQAAVYVTGCQDLWEKTPGAVEYIKRMINTQELGDIMHKGAKAINPKQEVPRVLDLIDDGIFPSTIHRSDNGVIPLLHLAVFQGKDAYMVIDKLVAAGTKIKVEVDGGLTALHKACYYGCDRPVIQSLIKAGLSPVEPMRTDKKRFPVLMAAEQGNWIELEECLLLLPTFTPSLYSSIFDRITSSSCVECVAGGAKCNRCVHGDRPHSPNVDYYKIADILYACGFRLSSFAGLEIFLTRSPKPGPYKDFMQYVYDTFKGVPVKDRRGRGGASVSECCWGGCGNADQVEAGSMPLKFCLGCKTAWYCSRECQVADWKTHKVACKAAQKAKIPTNKK